MILIYSFVHNVLTNYRGKEFLDTCLPRPIFRMYNWRSTAVHHVSFDTFVEYCHIFCLNIQPFIYLFITLEVVTDYFGKLWSVFMFYFFLNWQ